jgi:hypothetical protein
MPYHPWWGFEFSSRTLHYPRTRHPRVTSSSSGIDWIGPQDSFDPQSFLFHRPRQEMP